MFEILPSFILYLDLEPTDPVKYVFLILDETGDLVEVYTRDTGAIMNSLVDIFEETTEFNDRLFLLNLPPETINIINTNISFGDDQSLGEAFTDMLSDSMKIKFLVRCIQYNGEDILDFADKTVVFRGVTNNVSQLSFWYEVTPKDGKSNKVFMREGMSTHNNLNWIFRKSIKTQTTNTNVESEDINAIAIEFPIHDEGGTLYFPFYLLMMLRCFCNNAEYFFTKINEYFITLYFIVPHIFQHRNDLREQVVDVIASLIRDINEQDLNSRYNLVGWTNRQNISEYNIIIEPYKKCLVTLGIVPGSLLELHQYISDVKVLDPTVFSVTLVSTIPNRTNMFSVPR